MEITLEKIRQFKLTMLEEVLSTKDPKNITKEINNIISRINMTQDVMELLKCQENM